MIKLVQGVVSEFYLASISDEKCTIIFRNIRRDAQSEVCNLVPVVEHLNRYSSPVYSQPVCWDNDFFCIANVHRLKVAILICTLEGYV